jgi:hypothetical protein
MNSDFKDLLKLFNNDIRLPTLSSDSPGHQRHFSGVAAFGLRTVTPREFLRLIEVLR